MILKLHSIIVPHNTAPLPKVTIDPGEDLTRPRAGSKSGKTEKRRGSLRADDDAGPQSSNRKASTEDSGEDLESSLSTSFGVHNDGGVTPTLARIPAPQPAKQRRQSISPARETNPSPVNNPIGTTNAAPVIPGMQLKRDMTSIIAKLAGRSKSVLAREAEWRSYFQLPESDYLVGDWSAAFMKGVARQGRLYVFTEHLAFFSNLFGVKTCFTIPYVDILAIEKSVENLTPGLIVRTVSGEYHFGGIYSRVQCLDQINGVWKGSYVLVETPSEEDSQMIESSTLSPPPAEEEVPQELLSQSTYVFCFSVSFVWC
jgi:hypothetical protein